MTTLTRTVITVETTPGMLGTGRALVHDALLDGDEGLGPGVQVLLHDGAGTYRAARVDGRDGEYWELTLTTS